jgi:hypothetical protein
MQVDKVKASGASGERATHRRRPVEPTQDAAWEIRDLYAFDADRRPERHGTVARPVDACREGMDFVAKLRQSTTQSMNRTDRATIPHSGQIGRDNVQKAQKLVRWFKGPCGAPVSNSIGK